MSPLLSERLPSGSDGSTPVLIAGGGPVGLALAVELGLRDIKCTIVEPRLSPTRTRPRAKTLNVRTMEHFRRWGLAARLRARAPLPVEWSRDVSFATTLLGREIYRFHGALGLEDIGVSPEQGQQLPQYVLEDLLREVVAELPACTLLIGARVVAVEQSADLVKVTVRAADGGHHELAATYVVGADGARSAVRPAVGAAYEGSRAGGSNTGVVFRSDELMALLPHPPAVQTWLLNGETPGLMGPVDRYGTWWLIAFGVNGDSEDLDPVRLVHGAVGATLPVEIVSIDPWTARMKLVDRCSVGRVFLVGDAAHLNPPFGGHGLNTGIGDAVDLGWKLSAVLDGWAGPELLDTYAVERRPLHQRVIEEATANNAVLAPSLVEAGLDETGADGSAARIRAAERIQATKRAEYFSYDLVLGHRYTASPIIPLAVGEPVPDARAIDDWARHVQAGRRIPHVWIGPGVSTLDLVGRRYRVLAPADVDVADLIATAKGIGMPLDSAEIPAAVAAGFGARVTIVRPDHIVAWSGDVVPRDARRLLSDLAVITYN
ncbi:FAD-dependent monooxygenase [Kribbella sp. NPDC055071]